MRLTDAYLAIRRQFRAASLETPDLDARLLLCHALAISPISLVNEPDRIVSPIEQDKIEEIIKRRIQHEPVARIIGVREFWGHQFLLSADTLEPRPDTETLVEAVVNRLSIKSQQDVRILDLGTGAGAILLSLLSEFSSARGFGTDINPGALHMARENAQRLGLTSRVWFFCANYLDAIGSEFDVIVSNPPYIPSNEIKGLAQDVAGFDPMRALDGGVDGLGGIREIFESVSNHLSPDGIVAVEFGFGQSDDVTDIARKTGLVGIETIRDIGNRHRVVLARKP